MREQLFFSQKKSAHNNSCQLFTSITSLRISTSISQISRVPIHARSAFSFAYSPASVQHPALIIVIPFFCMSVWHNVCWWDSIKKALWPVDHRKKKKNEYHLPGIIDDCWQWTVVCVCLEPSYVCMCMFKSLQLPPDPRHVSASSLLLSLILTSPCTQFFSFFLLFTIARFARAKWQIQFIKSHYQAPTRRALHAHTGTHQGVSDLQKCGKPCEASWKKTGGQYIFRKMQIIVHMCRGGATRYRASTLI